MESDGFFQGKITGAVARFIATRSGEVPAIDLAVTLDDGRATRVTLWCGEGITRDGRRDWELSLERLGALGYLPEHGEDYARALSGAACTVRVEQDGKYLRGKWIGPVKSQSAPTNRAAASKIAALFSGRAAPAEAEAEADDEIPF